MTRPLVPMSDLFTTAIPADSILSSRFRVHMVESDGMEPALRAGRDYALIAPANAYCGEGIYLVELAGAVTLYRIQNTLDGKLCMTLDNPLYRTGRGSVCTHTQFAEICLGIVVADIKVRDEHRLREVSR